MTAASKNVLTSRFMEDGREHKAKNFFNFFLNLDKVHLQETFAYIWQ